MPTHTQADSRTRNFPYLCAATQPPTAHFHSNPARFPPKIPAFTEFSGFSRNFAEKCAPSTSEHIAAQNQRLPGRAHLRAERQPHPQFPIPLCCHPAARSTFPPDSRRKIGFLLKFSAFSRDFSEKCAPSAPKCDATQKQKQRPCPPTYRPTAIPTISRISAYRPAAPNCSAKATAAAHTCAQNRDHAHNFL